MTNTHTKIDQMFKWVPFWLVVLMMLALGSTAHCQQQQTVYQTVGTGVGVTGIVGSNLQNIGQSFHLISVYARNAPAQTCPAISGTLALQSSFDNSQWLDLRVLKIEAATSIFASTFSAQGAFPFLRVNVLGNLDTQCVWDISYSGNVTGSTITNSIPARLDNLSTISGKLTGPGLSTVGPVCAAGMYAMFYGGYFTNVGAVALTASAGLEFTTNNAAVGLVIRLEKTAVGASLTLPMGPRPYSVGLPNATLTTGYGLTAAAGDVITYDLVFRCE